MLPIFGGQYHVDGLYDLDNDGVREVLVLQSVEPMAMLIEVTSTSISDTLWSYTLPDGRQFTEMVNQILLLLPDFNRKMETKGGYLCSPVQIQGLKTIHL